MKRLFWTLLGAIAGGIVLWFFARRRMDGMYAEISRLREFERKEQAMDAALDAHEAKWDAKQAEYLASLSPQERLDYEMNQAQINSSLKEQLGEDIYNELRS